MDKQSRCLQRQPRYSCRTQEVWTHWRTNTTMGNEYNMCSTHGESNRTKNSMDIKQGQGITQCLKRTGMMLHGYKAKLCHKRERKTRQLFFRKVRSFFLLCPLRNYIMIYQGWIWNPLIRSSLFFKKKKDPERIYYRYTESTAEGNQEDVDGRNVSYSKRLERCYLRSFETSKSFSPLSSIHLWVWMD